MQGTESCNSASDEGSECREAHAPSVLLVSMLPLLRSCQRGLRGDGDWVLMNGWIAALAWV